MKLSKLLVPHQDQSVPLPQDTCLSSPLFIPLSCISPPPPPPSLFQYKLHLPASGDSYQVVFPREVVEKGEVDVMEKLEEFTAEQVGWIAPKP